jgi:hypothetical protein
MAPLQRSPFSPSQPWAQSFPPANPPIASQSITRDAPFSQVGMASTTMLPPSSLVFFPRRDTFASESIPEGRGSAPLSREGKLELTEESRLSQP